MAYHRKQILGIKGIHVKCQQKHLALQTDGQIGELIDGWQQSDPYVQALCFAGAT